MIDRFLLFIIYILPLLFVVPVAFLLDRRRKKGFVVFKKETLSLIGGFVINVALALAWSYRDRAFLHLGLILSTFIIVVYSLLYMLFSRYTFTVDGVHQKYTIDILIAVLDNNNITYTVMKKPDNKIVIDLPSLNNSIKVEQPPLKTDTTTITLIKKRNRDYWILSRTSTKFQETQLPDKYLSKQSTRGFLLLIFVLLYLVVYYGSMLLLIR